MDWISLTALAVSLAMDAFAVALAAGAIITPLTFRPCFRLAFHFGLFQAMMPVIGWFAGLTIQSFVHQWSHWIAFFLLAFIGGKMIYEAVNTAGDEKKTVDPSKGLSLVALSVATSIDALAVGISFAMLNIVVWFPAIVIGLVAMFCTALGMLLGARLGSCWGKWVEIAGGVVLVGIGMKILSGTH